MYENQFAPFALMCRCVFILKPSLLKATVISRELVRRMHNEIFDLWQRVCGELESISTDAGEQILKI